MEDRGDPRREAGHCLLSSASWQKGHRIYCQVPRSPTQTTGLRSRKMSTSWRKSWSPDVGFRCGYCPALSVRDGPAHNTSCPRYKPPAPRRRGHKWIWVGTHSPEWRFFRERNLESFGRAGGWMCKRCRSVVVDCTKPYPRHPPKRCKALYYNKTAPDPFERVRTRLAGHDPDWCQELLCDEVIVKRVMAS